MSEHGDSGPTVSAVIVNMNQREHVRRCIASVSLALDQLPGTTELVVVDNGSTDGSNEMIHDEFPHVRLIEEGRNIGFPPAAAHGVGNTTGDWILLLNNDATIAPDGIHRLLSVATSAPDIGSVAAKILFADGSDRINSAGFGVDRLGVAYERLLGQPAVASERAPVEVFGASGGGALLRRAMLEDVGGIDESFFVYLEDVDLAWRARGRGWRCMYVPAAVVHHHHSATTGHGSDFKYFHVGLNRVRILAKNASTAHLIVYGPAIVAYDLAYVAFVAVRDRSLAPLRGRWQGITEWRSYRRGQRARDCTMLEPVRGVREALRRRAAWNRNSSLAIRTRRGRASV